MPLWNWEKRAPQFSVSGERFVRNWQKNPNDSLHFAGAWGRTPCLPLSTASFLPPSLTFLLNGDQTPMSRGLSHFVCILTVILKRQSVKVFPQRGEGVEINYQLKDIWGRDLLSIHYHYLRLIEIHCSSASALPVQFSPLQSFISFHTRVNR